MHLALGKAPARIVPYAYQQAAVDATFANWQARPASSQIIVAPTGAGKTIMIGMSAERYHAESGERVLCLTHSPELVMQNYLTFRQMMPDVHAGIYAAKLDRKDRTATVTFALVQSVARNIHFFRRCGLIIIDEAHLVPHSSDGQYRTVIEEIRKARGGPDKVRILGLTATPWRLNSGNLVEPYKDMPALFDEISYEIDMLDLIEDGKLSKVVARCTKQGMDTKGIHKKGGEFVEGEMNARFNRDDVNDRIAKETVTAGLEQDRKSWLVFCISVNHAERMRDKIRALGVSCEMVCGETPDGERKRHIADFKAFRLRCLTSVNVLGTGFDHKAVDLVAMARPTASPGLYLQQAGRALRTYPGKLDALLLDFAGNVMRHGLLTNVKGVHRKATKDEDTEAEVKACPACSLIQPAGKMTCEGCGHVFSTREAADREGKLHGRNMADRVMDETGGWAEVLNARFRRTDKGWNGKPGVLQLTYKVRMADGTERDATEAFCLDHDPFSWALKNSRRQWTQRTGKQAPASVLEAEQRIAELEPPKQVRVQQSDNGRYWNVRGTKFT